MGQPDALVGYFHALRQLRLEVHAASELVVEVGKHLVKRDGRRRQVYVLINLDADNVADAVCGILNSLDDAEKAIECLRTLMPDPQYAPPLLIQKWEIGFWNG